MHTVKVSEQGQVIIPVEIRQRLNIGPGSELDFRLEGRTIRMDVKRRVEPTQPDDGYGMLVCTKPGVRRLAEFDVAEAMREAADDRA